MNCACCSLRPPARAGLKYCSDCGPKIRARYKGASREAYRRVIESVRAAAQAPKAPAGDPPSRYWLELFYNSVRLEHPVLALDYGRKR